MTIGRTIIVDGGSDSFAGEVARALAEDGHSVRLVSAKELAACQLTMEAEVLCFEREPVHTVIFHARPDTHFAVQFQESDSGFCSNEARAAWLGAFHVQKVITLNRYDAEVWYSGAEWAVWRRRFASLDVPLVPLAVGDVSFEGSASWLTWGGGELPAPGRKTRRVLAPALVHSGASARSIWCCGEVVEGPENQGVSAATAVLERYGIRLAAVATDSDGRVVNCTAYPEIPDALSTPLANTVVGALNADLYRW